MSDPKKSFFSGLTGVVTGLAAILSAIVGLVGLSVNQGWIGGGKHASTTSSPTTVSGQPEPGGTTSSTGSIGSAGSTGSTGSTDAGPQFTINPTSIAFQAIGARDATVKVTNSGTVSFTVQPSISGPNADRFSVADQNCGSVSPGRSCDLKVMFTPKPGTFNATLVVQVTGAVRAVEIPIQATAIL